MKQEDIINNMKKIKFMSFEKYIPLEILMHIFSFLSTTQLYNSIQYLNTIININFYNFFKLYCEKNYSIQLDDTFPQEKKWKPFIFTICSNMQSTITFTFYNENILHKLNLFVPILQDEIKEFEGIIKTSSITEFTDKKSRYVLFGIDGSYVTTFKEIRHTGTNIYNQAIIINYKINVGIEKYGVEFSIENEACGYSCQFDKNYNLDKYYNQELKEKSDSKLIFINDSEIVILKIIYKYLGLTMRFYLFFFLFSYLLKWDFRLRRFYEEKVKNYCKKIREEKIVWNCIEPINYLLQNINEKTLFLNLDDK